MATDGGLFVALDGFYCNCRIFPGVMELLNEAEREWRNGSHPLCGILLPKEDGGFGGYVEIGTVTREGGVVTLEGLEPWEGGEA